MKTSDCKKAIQEKYSVDGALKRRLKAKRLDGNIVRSFEDDGYDAYLVMTDPTDTSIVSIQSLDEFQFDPNNSDSFKFDMSKGSSYVFWQAVDCEFTESGAFFITPAALWHREETVADWSAANQFLETDPAGNWYGLHEAMESLFEIDENDTVEAATQRLISLGCEKVDAPNWEVY